MAILIDGQIFAIYFVEVPAQLLETIRKPLQTIGNLWKLLEIIGNCWKSLESVRKLLKTDRFVLVGDGLMI